MPTDSPTLGLGHLQFEALLTTMRNDDSGRASPTVIAVTVICAASMLALGIWTYGAPESFFQFIDYAPYNRHLIHDVGALQIGIGAALLLALAWSDALLVTLSGFVVASALHTVSHAVDRHIGGHSSDVPSLGLLTLLAVLAIAVRLNRRSLWRGVVSPPGSSTG